MSDLSFENPTSADERERLDLDALLSLGIHDPQFPFHPENVNAVL
jgi:hypothetical protein